MGSTVIAVGFFWWNPASWGVAALPFLGLALAGIFPTLVALTPAWVGSDRSPAVIGYQIAASSVGAATLPWAAGQLMGETHLENLGPFLFVLAVAMAGLNFIVDKTTGVPVQRGLSGRLASLLTKPAKSSQP